MFWGVQTRKRQCFGGSKSGNLHVLGGSKPGNLHVLAGPNLETCRSKPGNLHALGGPNLETSTFWHEVQTWKPALETARFGGSKPGNLHVSGVQTWKPARLGVQTWKPGLKEKLWGVETYQKGPEHEGFGVFRAFGFSGTEPNRTECAQNR